MFKCQLTGYFSFGKQVTNINIKPKQQNKGSGDLCIPPFFPIFPNDSFSKICITHVKIIKC